MKVVGSIRCHLAKQVLCDTSPAQPMTFISWDVGELYCVNYYSNVIHKDTRGEIDLTLFWTDISAWDWAWACDCFYVCVSHLQATAVDSHVRTVWMWWTRHTMNDNDTQCERSDVNISASAVGEAHILHIWTHAPPLIPQWVDSRACMCWRTGDGERDEGWMLCDWEAMRRGGGLTDNKRPALSHKFRRALSREHVPVCRQPCQLCQISHWIMYCTKVQLSFHTQFVGGAKLKQTQESESVISSILNQTFIRGQSLIWILIETEVKLKTGREITAH